MKEQGEADRDERAPYRRRHSGRYECLKEKDD